MVESKTYNKPRQRTHNCAAAFKRYVLMKYFLFSLLFVITGCVSKTVEKNDLDLESLYENSFKFNNISEERWVLESDNAFVIEDKYPQAPIHLLVISKEVVPTMLHAEERLLGEMLALAQSAAKKYGIDESGFRTVINTHPKGGQTVYHLHIHVIGGRQMKWPPG